MAKVAGKQQARGSCLTVFTQRIFPEKVMQMSSYKRTRERRYFQEVLVSCLSLAITACSASPSRNILGSYFPTWMVCALLGIVFVAVVRSVLVKTGVDASLPVPVIVYLCMWTAATLAIWLVWLG
ncbi:YtcA family lipoprotein [Dyella acidisoli]|nr:YtcA family lipoprotein [Dyella acidisoli]